MKKASFNRGMHKLQRRGYSKSSAFNQMKALAKVNQMNRIAGNTLKSRRIASRRLSRGSRVR